MTLLQASSQRRSSIKHHFILRVFMAMALWTILVNVAIKIPLERHIMKWSFHGGSKGQQQHNQEYDAPKQQKQQQQQQQQKMPQNETISSDPQPPSYISVRKLNDSNGRKYMLSLFREANVRLDHEMKEKLPPWSQVQNVVGDHPYILGLDKCTTYRTTVPAVERVVGAAGMFNSGTNLVTHLLKKNCQIPERLEKYGPNATAANLGFPWQVPWGKHTPAKYRLSHATKAASYINKEWVLPIVTIRNPYTWFTSTCKHNYMAKWDHDKEEGPRCPMLVKQDGSANPVTIKYGVNRNETHDSLAHVWNEWYNDYFSKTQTSDYPLLMIRMEDLVFYPKATTAAICECVGGTIRIDQPFSYAVDSAKPGKGHDHSTGFFQAWIQYSQPYKPQAGFSNVDYELSQQWLDSHLMEAFGYQHPPAPAKNE